MQMREIATKWLKKEFTNKSTQRAMVYAILDLADAIRESGKNIAKEIDNAREEAYWNK